VEVHHVPMATTMVVLAIVADGKDRLPVDGNAENNPSTAIEVAAATTTTTTTTTTPGAVAIDHNTSHTNLKEEESQQEAPSGDNNEEYDDDCDVENDNHSSPMMLERGHSGPQKHCLASRYRSDY
jgi:hypothetical protein